MLEIKKGDVLRVKSEGPAGSRIYLALVWNILREEFSLRGQDETVVHLHLPRGETGVPVSSDFYVPNDHADPGRGRASIPEVRLVGRINNVELPEGRRIKETYENLGPEGGRGVNWS